MTTFEKIAAGVVWVVVLAGAYLYFFNNEKRAQNVAVKEVYSAKADQRYDQGAYVESEKNISPTETVKVLVMPGRSNSGALDTKCLIYTNESFKQSNLACPNDTGLNLAQ